MSLKSVGYKRWKTKMLDSKRCWLKRYWMHQPRKLLSAKANDRLGQAQGY